MVELLREGMDAGAIGLSSGVFYATGAAADIDELALLAGIAGEAGGIYTTHIRDELDERPRLARRGVRDRAARQACRSSSRITSAPARSNWGRTVQTLAHIDAARATQPIGLDAYPYVAGLDRAAHGPGRRHHRHRRHLVGAASGDGGAAPGRHRRRVELHAAGSLRAAAARRRLLLPDARGRRAARAALSGDDDRLGRPAARSASASASVGNVSARARPLQPRSRPLPARDRRAQDDADCPRVNSSSQSAARFASARSPTSSCSIRRR